MRIAVVATALCLSIVGLSVAGPADASIRRETNIPAQPLAHALQVFAKQRGLVLAYRSEVVGDRQSTGAEGEFTTDEALTRILSGTGLTYRYLDDKTVTIVLVSAAPPATTRSQVEGQGGTAVLDGDNKVGFWDKFLLAQATSGQSQNAASPAPSTTTKEGATEGQLQEVVVTAQKRRERLEDVPASVSAISGDRLQSLQVNTLSDMASYIPGMAVEEGGSPGYRTIVLRGLNSSYNTNTTGPTVATYVDDLPIGASNAGARSAQFGVDLQPYDVDQVEVLKGPQGTLYGANTLAGLVKYRLREPDLTETTAIAGTDVEQIDGSSGLGSSVHGAVSVPVITDSLAIRISGFKKYTAGYIDNIGINLSDANSSSEYGGIASLLWKPTDKLAVHATILTQDVNAANQTEVSINPVTLTPLYGPAIVNTNFPEPNWNKLRSYSLTFDWDLGFATLTSASGYSEFENTMTEDLTAYGVLCLPDPAAGIPGCPDYPHADALADYVQYDYVHKFVQEVRLQSPTQQRFQWMLGGYYTRENSFESEYFPAYTPSRQLLPPRDDIVDSLIWGVYKETAVFANLTYQISDLFDVSAGDRYSRYSGPPGHQATSGTLGTGPSSTPSVPGTGVSVWMADARLHLSQDASAYARIATGYQPGSAYVPFGPGESGIVLPARTTNYELGLKGLFDNRRLQFDAAVFYINWDDIQIAQVDARNFGYPGNGGKARSSGVEFGSTYQATPSLRFNATLAYTDAHLLGDAPGAGGKSGDQLPESPRWTGSATADFSRPISSNYALLLGGGYRYRDKVDNQFAGTGMPLPMGPMNLVDFYVGLMRDNVAARLYATNVFDNRSYIGLLFISQSQFVRYVPVQPRTIGFSLEYRF